MIWIPGNVPSSKNSKVATAKYDERTGKIKQSVFNSSQVAQYLKNLGVKSYGPKGAEDYKTRPNLFREAVSMAGIKTDYPIILGMHFVRQRRGRFDFNNASQIICDLLTAHGFIDDDDCDHLFPVPMWYQGAFYSVDKHAAGVWLNVFDREIFKRAVTLKPF